MSKAIVPLGAKNPESDPCIKLENFYPWNTKDNACATLNKQTLTTMRLFKFFVQIIAITVAIMIAYKAAASRIEVLNNVIKHYGLVQTTLTTLLLFGSVVKAIETGVKCYKSARKPELTTSERARAVSYGVVSTAIPLVDIARGIAAIGTLALFFSGKFVFTGKIVMMGISSSFLITTLLKNGLKATETALASVGGKAIESDEAEKTHTVTLVLAGTAGLAEVILSLFNLCRVGDNVTRLVLGTCAASIGGFEAIKGLSDDASKAKRKNQVDKENDAHAKRTASAEYARLSEAERIAEDRAHNERVQLLSKDPERAPSELWQKLKLRATRRSSGDTAAVA